MSKTNGGLIVYNEMVVEWKKRKWVVMGIGFWRDANKKPNGWHHPSSMPRGLNKAWREAKKAKAKADANQ